uniref:aminotransferase-like domain-containing protein n=1 Tax=Rhodococcus qingshengii TaxID=334542 RepID=UPI001C4E0EF3
VPIPVDDKGIDVATGIDTGPAAKIAVVTPSHQFPLGTTMALERRLALIDWAAQSGAWVIEDDYDNEFHYQGRPLAALQAIDPHGRVIYIGTFSKVMYPGLRLGYIIAPPDLVDGFIAAHLSTDMHSHLLDQAVLADFMEAGHFNRHLRRMRLLYHNRQRLLVDEARQLGKKIRVDPTPNGLHLIGWLPDGTDELNLAEQAAHHNLHLWPLSQHCINRALPPALLLGYAGSEDTHIRHGMQILRDLLN